MVRKPVFIRRFDPSLSLSGCFVRKAENAGGVRRYQGCGQDFILYHDNWDTGNLYIPGGICFFRPQLANYFILGMRKFRERVDGNTIVLQGPYLYMSKLVNA